MATDSLNKRLRVTQTHTRPVHKSKEAEVEITVRAFGYFCQITALFCVGCCKPATYSLFSQVLHVQSIIIGYYVTVCSPLVLMSTLVKQFASKCHWAQSFIMLDLAMFEDVNVLLAYLGG